MKTDHPILFSAPMIRALQDGEKTQTRRIIKPIKGEELDPDGIYTYHPRDHELARCPYGKPGDLLWVRETFLELSKTTAYKADFDDDAADRMKWKPSIFMPRSASRLTLKITEIRVQHLRDISEMDAYAEGIDTNGGMYIAAEHAKLGGVQGRAASIIAYADLWDSINGSGSWYLNPWVWAISFNVHKQNIDTFRKENSV